MDCLISDSEVFCLKLFPVGISFIVKGVVSYGFIIPGNHGVVCASKLHEYILHTLESSFLNVTTFCSPDEHPCGIPPLNNILLVANV